MQDLDESPDFGEDEQESTEPPRPELDRPTLEAFAALDAKLLELVEVLGGQQERLRSLAEKAAKTP
jgi:hypothetical protein